MDMLYAGLLEAKPNSVTDKQYTSSLWKDWMILASNIVAAMHHMTSVHIS